jgi:hypothetical protein
VIASRRPGGAARGDRGADERVTGVLVDYHLDRGNGIASRSASIRQRFGDRFQRS